MEITQEDRDRAMRILNFAFRNTDVEISGECFDDMASEIAAHREAAAKASEQAVLAKLRACDEEMAHSVYEMCPPHIDSINAADIQTIATALADALEGKQS